MPEGFVGTYLMALVVIALLLFGLYTLVRALGRGRVLAGADRRLISVIDSTFVAQNTTLHIVKIGEKFYAVGGGAGHLALLCEVPAAEVTPWIELQRQLYNTQTQSISGFLKYLRRPPQ